MAKSIKAKRRITRAEFYAEFVNNMLGRYRITYTSPKTNKEWVMYTNDSDYYEDVRDDYTTQKRLNEIKSAIKWASRPKPHYIL